MANGVVSRQILVVDDEPGIRALLEQILTEAGHSVREASNCVEAVVLFRQSPAELLILDVMIPGQDPFETMQELQVNFPGCKVLMMSGGDPHNLAVAKMMGANEVIAKPVREADLMGVIGKLFASEARAAAEQRARLHRTRTRRVITPRASRLL